MSYTISPATLRNLAAEFAADLANVNERLEDCENITPQELRYWEARRELLSRQHGNALLFAQDVERLNGLKKTMHDYEIRKGRAA